MKRYLWPVLAAVLLLTCALLPNTVKAAEGLSCMDANGVSHFVSPSFPCSVGKTIKVCVTPPVTATNSYGTNFVVGNDPTGGAGTALRFANIFTATGSGILQTVSVNMKKVESQGFTFVPFKSNPSSSTWTDASVAAINAADVDKVLPPIALTGSSVLGTHTNASGNQLAIALSPGTTDLYGVLLANSTLTNQFAATSDVTSVCVTVLADP